MLTPDDIALPLCVSDEYLQKGLATIPSRTQAVSMNSQHGFQRLYSLHANYFGKRLTCDSNIRYIPWN